MRRYDRGVKTAVLGRATAPTRRELQARLARRARKAGVQLPPEAAAGLIDYFELLSRWNHKINLTSLPLFEPTDETFDRLFTEPLVAARHIKPRSHILDIGSGGGSPAIPLKLALPGITLRMVEAKTRKAAFLREAVRHLKLENVEVETSRFEELLAQPGLHEAFDVATLRAVRIEPKSLRTVHAFLKPGGRAFLFRAFSSRPVLPETLPTFQLDGTYTLVESLESQLVILKKRRFRERGA
jgi:16S rRNA (guanine527-N7)-methyltransferase